MATSDIQFKPDDFIVLPALQAEPSAVAVRADSKFKTMKDFMDFIRAHPDQVSVGGFSSAGFHQFVFYRLQQDGHFKSIWVPFAGGQDAALGAARRPYRCRRHDAEFGAGADQERRLRLLGISSAERNEYFPDVPTFKEQGYDVAASIWRGVMVKAGTPQPIVDKLNAALDTMKKTEEWQKFSQLNMQSSVNRLAGADAEPGAPGSPRRRRIPQGDGASQMTRLPRLRPRRGGDPLRRCRAYSFVPRPRGAGSMGAAAQCRIHRADRSRQHHGCAGARDPENLAADACRECDR